MVSNQNKFISLIILLLSLFGIMEVNGEAPRPPDYTLNEIDIVTDNSAGYKAVELNYYIYDEIFNNYYETDNNLNSLRIVDGKGEYVPYFLESGEGSNRLSKVREDSNSTTYKITNLEKATVNYVPYTMTFNKPNNNKEYIANVEVYGSNDDTDYELITKDILYFTDGRIKDFIELADCENYSYFKVVYEQNTEIPDFTDINIKYGYYKSEDLTELQKLQEGDTNIDMAYEVTQLNDTNETEIIIHFIDGLYVDNIEIFADGVFVRDVVFDDNIYEIYNYSKDGMPITNTKVYADSQNFCEEYSKKIIIKNNDDKPINITGVNVTYRYERAVFESSGVDNYYVEFGNRNLEEPIYDIQKLRSKIIDEGYDILELGEVETTDVFEPIEPYDENEDLLSSLLENDIDWLNVTVVGVAVVLVFIVINAVKS